MLHRLATFVSQPRVYGSAVTRTSGFLVLLAVLSTTSAQASLDLPTHHYGISFGNSTVFHGLRFNFADHDVERLDVLSFTLWRAHRNDVADMNGLMLGLWGPTARRLTGVTLGGLSIRATTLHGLAISGVGLGVGATHENDRYVAEAKGILVGGVGIGAERLVGIALGGIGVGGEDVTGIVIGGIGVGANRLHGLAAGGVGVGGDEVHGIALGGLGVGGDEVFGIAIGGIGMGADHFHGLGIGGLGVGADELVGLCIGGLGVGADHVRGLTVAGVAFRAGDFEGLSVAPYVRVRGQQHGVTIGVLNIAHQLHGVQIGVLNWAGDNPAGLKLLPVLNAHF